MRNTNRRNEKGVALLLSILALLLLSAIAVGMMYMSSTETTINANFKTEETEYFASRSGIEEIRDRMIPGTVPYSINGLNPGPNPPCPADANCYLPTQVPNAGNGGVVYLLQSGVTTAQVFSRTIGGNLNPLFDDELCHDYAAYGGMSPVATNVRCTTLPGGAGAPWYSIPGLGIGATVTGSGLAAGSPGVSSAPTWPSAGTSNPLDWKWVRITIKANNSGPYCVDQNCANGAAKVCWDGNTELPLVGFPDCTALPAPLNPVYLVTALAVSPTGARRLIQTEVAQKPPSNPPAGLWATGTACPALTVSGGAVTSSFYSANEATPKDPPTNVVAQNGDVGANGGVSIQGTPTTIDGTAMSASQGGCNPAGVTTSGNPTMLNPPINNQTPYNQSPPSVPKNVPTGAYTPPTAPATWPAGTYGDVNITKSTILPGGTPGNPAIYNINSLTISGSNTFAIKGPVIFNIACGPASNPCPGAAVSIGSNVNLNNSSFIPGNFVIDYGVPASSAGAINIKGNTDIFVVIDAPNAAVSLTGGTNVYGSVIGNSINVAGGTNFIWDRSLQTPPPLTEPFTEITMRELSY